MGRSNNKFLDKLVSRTKVYLVIIAILLLIICFIKPILIIPAVIVYILIIAYTYLVNQKRVAEVSEHIKDLTFDVDKMSKRTLINSPFPLVIVETDGSIIWKSTKFTTEFAETDINEDLASIVKEIRLEILNNNKKNKQILKKVNIGNKNYKLVGEYVKSKAADKKKEYMVTLYFIDETEIDNLKKDYQNSRICVGITMIDNYEELIQRISTEKQIQVFSEIEKLIG